MSLNLSCLNSYEDILLIRNKSRNYFHPIYKPNGENFLSKFSSLITSSSFSSIDLELFLKTGYKLPTKFISSIIIYSSLTILLFLTCSIIFYIISYSNRKKFQLSKIHLKKLSIILLIIIYLVLFIQMIFHIENLKKTKINFDKSIEEINREFNSKTFSKHIKYLLNKLEQFSTNSIIIYQSKLLIIKIFSNLLNNYYYIEQINLFVKNIKKYFNQFQISDDEIIKEFFNLNKNICSFIEKNHFDIEQKILYLLNLIYQQFTFFIQFFNEQILNKINFYLFNNNQQQQIRSAILLIINLTIINITFITIIPIAFLIIIIINYHSCQFNQQNNR